MTERSHSPADVATGIETLARQLVDRARGWTPTRWLGKAGPDASRAHVVQELVVTLAELEHAAATGDGQPPAAWRSPAPPPYPGALPDRLAVVTYDLVAALRQARQGQDVWYAGKPAPLQVLAAAALAEIERSWALLRG